MHGSIMAKRVFFSFHYQDVIDFRANVVRNSWLCKTDREVAGFFDASLWESAKRTSDDALKRLINSGLQNTSATAVLIGDQTCNRRWVRYEIIKSLHEGKRVIGVHINGIRCKNQNVKPNGPNPFDYIGLMYSHDGREVQFYEAKLGQWVKYTDISAALSLGSSRSEYAGKFLTLSQFCPIYDWNLNAGFSNFGNWLE